MLLFLFIPLVYVVYLSPICSQTHLQSCEVSLNMIKHIRPPIFFYSFLYLFTFDCAGSSLLCGLSSSGCEWRLSPAVVCGLRPGMASLAAERGLEGVWASVAGAHLAA